jgi:hypothetical protein
MAPLQAGVNPFGRESEIHPGELQWAQDAAGCLINISHLVRIMSAHMFQWGARLSWPYLQPSRTGENG